MKKRIHPTIVAAMLTVSMSMQSFAAGWVRLDGEWYLIDDDGKNLQEAWHEENGTWYYLDEDGKMQTGWMLDPAGNAFYLNPDEGELIGSMSVGWKLINSVWYFFNTIHDGTYGKVLTGWQWIDGYCYYFTSDGKLLQNVITPDGFQVNSDGAWVDGGDAVFVEGKGIHTGISVDSAFTSNIGGSGGSGGSGGKGNNNNVSSEKNYSYVVKCIDISTNETLAIYNRSAKKDATVEFDYEFNSYGLVPGQEVFAILSEDGIEFVRYYEHNLLVPVDEYLTYRILHVDIDTGEVLDKESFKGKRGDEIIINHLDIAGYLANEDQTSSYDLYENGLDFIAYYKRIQLSNEFTFKVEYIAKEDGSLLGELYGRVISGTKVILDLPEFNGYQLDGMQSKSYDIDEDGMVFTIYYVQEDLLEVATPSEPGIEKYSYTVTCYDIESGKEIGFFQNEAEAGEKVKVEYLIPGFVAYEPYSFTIDDDGLAFDIFYKKESVPKEYKYTIRQLDITTKDEISQIEYEGAAGEEITLSGLALDGYELLGNPPDTIKISATQANNHLNLYYKEMIDTNPEEKEVGFKVEFVDADNPQNHILNDVFGSGVAGESIPIYFFETVKTSDGKTWKSIGSSPRLFELNDIEYNVFTIEYQNTDESVIPKDTLMEYSVRYVAEDTGAVLGVTSGFGKIGTKVAFRNNLGNLEYGILDSATTSLTVSDVPADNNIEVLYKRISYPGPEPDPTSGQYIGNYWTVLFIDTMGNQLMRSQSGFSLQDEKLIIDYPDEIEMNGSIYRARMASPYNEIQAGTEYRQITILYEKGDEADSKLEYWKQKSFEALDEINKTRPLSYYISYMEKDSWNDIALRVGVGTKGSTITIPIPEITNYTSPTEKIDGFQLTQDNMKETVSYARVTNGTSAQLLKTSYTVHFQDAVGNNIFEPYTGYVALDGDESKMNLTVYYPNSFMDNEGNLWEADIASPAILLIDALSQNGNTNDIQFHKVYENPKEDMIVEDSSEAMIVFEAIGSRITDANEQVFYLIGKGYSPINMNPTSIMTQYGLVGYSNTLVDSFEYEGIMYHISEIHISRKWDESSCVHDWHVVRKTEGSCLINGSETLSCSKCDKTTTVIIPAIGHIDINHDSICDVCGLRAFIQILGDEIKIEYMSLREQYSETYTFLCIDDNYKGSGKMLYLCTDDIPSAVYGTYSINNQVRFDDSTLRYFLNDAFADGLSLKGALQTISQDRVSILTKEEIDFYKENAFNKYPFPSGTFITGTTTNQEVMLSNGSLVLPEEADNYPVRPVILLDKPIENETPLYRWQVGDVQARVIAGEIYLFRCVNEAYKDKTNTSVKKALFLCDSVIPASVVDDGFTESTETLFFGESNNYKYSYIKEWLDANSTDGLLDASIVNIGVDSAYSGSTQLNGYSNLNERLLNKYSLSAQYMEAKLFIPSLEEALQMKDYLWKFGDTQVNNPEMQMRPFSYSYWLRTPEYGTDNIYTVNLETGQIEPTKVSATEQDSYSEVGIRPVFTMTQYE